VAVLQENPTADWAIVSKRGPFSATRPEIDGSIGLEHVIVLIWSDRPTIIMAWLSCAVIMHKADHNRADSEECASCAALTHEQISYTEAVARGTAQLRLAHKSR
jgi:hypothetical protein